MKAAGQMIDVLPSVQYIEITDPNSEALVQFHDDVLVETFPNPFGREDVPILQRNLLEGSQICRGEVRKHHLIVARLKNRVIGGASFSFLSLPSKERKNVPKIRMALGMGSYLSVKKEFRGKGIGTRLITMRDQTLHRDAQQFDYFLKGLVIQVNDPKLMNPSEIQRDSMDPWEREAFWKRRGYRKINFNFIQPPIRGGEPPLTVLSLHLFPYCLKWKGMTRIPRKELSDIIDCFFKCVETPDPPESDPSYRQMKAELAQREYFDIL